MEETIGIAGVAMVQKIELIRFNRTLAALEGVTMYETPPLSGYITQIGMHFPDGCDGLVHVKAGHGVVQFCPKENYLSLNNATPTYPFNEWVRDDEEIWVEMRNASAFPHNITVTVTVEGTT